MQSLSAAIAQDAPPYLRWIISIITVTVIALFIWMAWAELDTVVRASGKIIPPSQVQKIQSLEGGVISEILVNEGDHVLYNQALIKISDISFSGSYEEGQIKYFELKARVVRLTAQANNTEFGVDEEVTESMPHLLNQERQLFLSSRAELNQNLNILNEQVKQAKNQLLETQAREKQMERNVSLLQQELTIKAPLVEREVLSAVDYLQLQGRESEASGQLESIQLSIPRIHSIIDESESQIEFSQLEFQSSARKELNQTIAEVSRLEETQTTLADRVARTTLRSPLEGIVKRIFTNTIGGVIQSGSDIIEVVPSEDALLVEVQIKPSDIANIEIGQHCRIKLTAYDFAIYGSIGGILRFISADTITDENGNSYYIARVEPDQIYIGAESRNLSLKVGMTSEVDIITGKKTILNYLLKPINRAMDNALREI